MAGAATGWPDPGGENDNGARRRRYCSRTAA